jgi:transcriptional regulator with XRE-family HTH domain
VPGGESVGTVGSKRSRFLRQRIAEELSNGRVTAGLSVREVARRVGVSPGRIERAERADATALTIDLAARIAPVIGLRLATVLHADGDPVRDRAHLGLLARFRARLHPELAWKTEVAMPIQGDRRAADAAIEGRFGFILVEAETRVTDIQAIERKAFLKARDFGARHVILLLNDTPHNRRVLSLHPELRERFPTSQRRCLLALGLGEDPGGNALVTL